MNSIHVLVVFAICGLLMAGCVSPTQNCGDFVMQASMKMPAENRTLTSPELSSGHESNYQNFTVRDLPVAIDPLAFNMNGTIDRDDGSSRAPSGIMEIKVFTFPEGELLGTAISRGPGSIERKREGSVRLAKDFTLMIRTKEAFNRKASLRVAYLLQIGSKQPNKARLDNPQLAD